jgi:hypothetical protein
MPRLEDALDGGLNGRKPGEIAALIRGFDANQEIVVIGEGDRGARWAGYSASRKSVKRE